MATLAHDPIPPGAAEWDTWVRERLSLGAHERVLELRPDPEIAWVSREPFDKVFALGVDPFENGRRPDLKVLRLLLKPEGRAYLFLPPRGWRKAARAAERIAAMLWDAGLCVEEIGFAGMEPGWAACVIGRTPASERPAGSPFP